MSHTGEIQSLNRGLSTHSPPRVEGSVYHGMREIITQRSQSLSGKLSGRRMRNHRSLGFHVGPELHESHEGSSHRDFGKTVGIHVEGTTEVDVR